jgi:hypothetical protein
MQYPRPTGGNTSYTYCDYENEMAGSEFARENLCDQRFIRPKETVLGPCCAFSLFGLCALRVRIPFARIAPIDNSIRRAYDSTAFHF